MKKTIIGTIGVIFALILLAFMGLSIYSGISGKSYKEIFTKEENVQVEDDEQPSVEDVSETELTICVTK